MDRFYEILRYQQKVAEEINAEKWVKVFIEREQSPGSIEKVELYSYDLPWEMYEKYEWVIRWRRSRLQCMYPRMTVRHYVSIYFRKDGCQFDYKGILGRYIAAKAQVTRALNVRDAYVSHRRSDIFFNEAEDGQLTRFNRKLAEKEKKLEAMEEEIRRIVTENGLKKT